MSTKLLKRMLANRIRSTQCTTYSIWTSDNIVRSKFKDITLPKETLTNHIWEKLDRWADKPALICGVSNRCITYHQLMKFSKIFAAQLRNKFNISDGNVVLIMMNNIPEYAITLLGAAEAGAEVTTVNPTYTVYEVQRHIMLSDPKILIGTPDMVPLFKNALKLSKKVIPIINCSNDNSTIIDTVSFNELIEDSHVNMNVLNNVKRSAEDVVLLPYSSGTTGLPKGVELTHRSIVSNFLQQNDEHIRQYEDTTVSHQDSVLAVLPFFHLYGLAIVLLHKLSVGCKIVTLPQFQPNTFVNALEQHNISILYAAPPLVLFLGSYVGVKQHHFDSIRRIMSAAAPIPKADIENILKKGKRMEFLQGYGLTETSPLVTTFEIGYQNYTSAGLPLPNTELKVVDPNGQALSSNKIGELLIRGPQVMKGYRNNTEATKNAITEDGWFKSGDLCSINEDGYVTVIDRLKELIKVKGFQVAPAELESVIKEHPSVLDAGVIGVPDENTGERPKAFIVLKDGYTCQAQDIASFVANYVADYKRLKEVEFVERLPKSPSGKLLRRVLKENF
ncbi:hypothetical protein ACJJTC_006398 [Scirpophaga incertulas]